MKRALSFVAALTTATLISVPAIATEVVNPYILLVPKMEGVVYTADQGHYSSEYSTEDYDVYLYEAGSQVTLGVNEYETISFKDALERDDFRGFELTETGVTFTMPEQDLEMLLTIKDPEPVVIGGTPENARLGAAITVRGDQGFTLEGVDLGYDRSVYTFEVYDAGNFTMGTKGAYPVIYKVSNASANTEEYVKCIVIVNEEAAGNGVDSGTESAQTADAGDATDANTMSGETEAIVETVETETAQAENAEGQSMATETVSYNSLFAVKTATPGALSELTMLDGTVGTSSNSSDFETNNGVSVIRVNGLNGQEPKLTIYKNGSLMNEGEDGGIIYATFWSGDTFTIDVRDWMTKTSDKYAIVIG